jgi:Apg6 BARA domain
MSEKSSSACLPACLAASKKGSMENPSSAPVELAAHDEARERSSTPPSDVNDLSGENRRLQEEIGRIRQRRRNLRQLRLRQESLLEALHLERNASLLRQEHAILDCVSAMRRKADVDAQLQHSQAWHALSDCFPISTMGAYGTINGLRLGSEAPVLETGKVDSKVSADVAAAAGSASSSPSAQYPPSSDHRESGPLPPYQSAASSTASSSPSSSSASSRVPWSEVNAAFGQVALLLVVMKERPHSGIALRHEIQPMGSTSKIVAGRGGSSNNATGGIGLKGAVAGAAAVGGRGWTYSLHSDDSFQFFGKRNFNSALTSLLECVVDAATCIQDRDRTISLPYEMVPTQATIGGLSFLYSPTPEWTRACKYLLTNLKHLMTYKVLSLTFLRPSNEEGESQDPPGGGG